jgi:hypothetical protein
VRGGVLLISSARRTFVKTTPGDSDDAADDLARRRVGRELHTLERNAEDARGRRSEKRLGGAGRALEQDVPSGERGDENLVDRDLVTENELADLGVRSGAQLGQLLLGRPDSRPTVRPTEPAPQGSGDVRFLDSCRDLRPFRRDTQPDLIL